MKSPKAKDDQDDQTKAAAKATKFAKSEAMAEISAETTQMVDAIVEELNLTKSPMDTDAYHAYQANENGSKSHFPFWVLINLAEKNGTQLTKEDLLVELAGIDLDAPKSAFCGVCGDEVRFTQQSPKAFKIEKATEGEKTVVTGITILKNERGRFVAKDNPEGTKTEVIALCPGCEEFGRENPNNSGYKLPMSSYRQAVERADERNGRRKEKTAKQREYQDSYKRQQSGGPRQSFGPAPVGQGINGGGGKKKDYYRR